MSSTMYGADPAQLQALSASMANSAERLTEIRALLTGRVSGQGWVGPDAERFREDWALRHSGHLAAVAAALTDVSARLRVQADEQIRASAGYGGSAPDAHAGGNTLLGNRGSITLAACWPDESVWRWPIYEFPDWYDHWRSWFDDWSVPVAVLDNFTGGHAGGPLNWIGLGSSLYDINHSWHEGDVGQVAMGGVGVAIDTVGMRVPHVAAAKLAWDSGWYAGEWIDSKTGISDYSSSAILGNTINEVYGGGDLTPSEAADLSHRYDGIGGVGNFIGDWARAIF